ncbi:MAG: hypothetical protein RMJ53_03405 [Chitinophagales bacterium]|nr:hypothetical protein [Chitinophagales bacterium]
MEIRKSGILILFLMMLCGSIAAGQADTDAQQKEYEQRLVLLLRQFSSHKINLKKEFPKADTSFFTLAESALTFCQQPEFSPPKRALYASALVRYMGIVYYNATEDEMIKGRWNNGLKYFAILCEWDNKKVLDKNITIYKKFTLAHSSLIPDDEVCERFLLDYARENPSEVLRYANHFAQRPFASRIIDSIALWAPDIVKKYLYSENDISYNVVKSKSPATRYLLNVYREYGQRSNAYVLAYNVLKNEFSMDEADSIGDNPSDLFKILVSNMKDPAAYGRHSAYSLLENYSIEQVRKANNLSVNMPGYAVADYFKFLGTEELLTVLVYGHRELTLQSFTNLLGTIKRKLEKPYTAYFIHSLNQKRFKEFLEFCERNEKLDLFSRWLTGHQ